MTAPAGISVVVPVHNGLALTLECLQSLVRHRDGTSFEVIVVDDASSDATALTLPPNWSALR